MTKTIGFIPLLLAAGCGAGGGATGSPDMSGGGYIYNQGGTLLNAGNMEWTDGKPLASNANLSNKGLIRQTGTGTARLGCVRCGVTIWTSRDILCRKYVCSRIRN